MDSIHNMRLFFGIIFVLSCTHSEVILEYKTEKFENPRGRLSNGRHCDIPLWGTMECDTIFDFCLGPPVTGRMRSCQYKNTKTDSHEDANDVYVGINGNNQIDEWVGFTLYVKVKDRDVTEEEEIDTLSYTYSGRPDRNSIVSEWKSQTVRGQRSSYTTSLEIQFRVYCSKHFYGKECRVKCNNMALPDNQFCDPDTGIPKLQGPEDKIQIQEKETPQAETSSNKRTIIIVSVVVGAVIFIAIILMLCIKWCVKSSGKMNCVALKGRDFLGNHKKIPLKSNTPV